MVKQSLKQPAPGVVAPGGRVYAVGDVHGAAGRLAELHRAVAADLAADPVPRPLLLHLGDYVDRGPHSATVVARLMSGTACPGVATANLRGNHEQMLLDALAGGREPASLWLRNGGDSTLRSWGVSPMRPVAEWRAAIGPAAIGFIAGLELAHEVDGYLFVHAGVRPGVPLPEQCADDLLWIREEFLQWPGVLLPDRPGTAVVHGHTPQARPSITANRIGIDTGAVAGGALTCAVLEGRTVRFLQA